MKIVILDPYFESLGGGEKVVVVMAEHLSKQHDVSILVKHPVDTAMVSNYFNVDLSAISFELLPRDSLFLRIISSRYVKLPGRWKSIMYDRGSLKALRNLKPDLFINNLYQSSLPSPAPKSIYMCMFPQKLELEDVYHSPVRRFYNHLTTTLENHFIGSRQQAVNSYDIVAANSNYTAGWVKRYWNRDAEVVYPVCDDMGPPADKKNIILTVGRFFADNGSSHHKRHDKLVDAFIRLNNPKWELHLAGSVADDIDSQKYFKKLQKVAAQHPNIHIHPNMDFADLRKLRQEAAIYWHATGLGYDAEIFPANQEHFGMVTAEAMSAGAVPVVYRGAGQLEVVQENINGLLWSTLDELIEQTDRVINDKALRHKMSEAAVQRAKDFGRPAFLKRVDALILEVSNGKS